MSESGAEKSYSSVRLRRPERRQAAMLIQCRDDLVGAGHAVRLVQAVAEKLDLGRFHEPIEARKGSAGRDATDPELPVSLWLCACIRGIGSARELARRCEGSAAFRWLCGGVTVNHRLLHPTDEDLSARTPVLHPTDEDLSARTPVLHPTDEGLSAGTPVLSDFRTNHGAALWCAPAYNLMRFGYALPA